MPTDQEIIDGVKDSAKLEVAKKLKMIYAQMKAKGAIPANVEEPDAKGYLDMAYEAIKERTLTINGMGTLKIDEGQVDDLFKAAAPEEYKKLNSTIKELVPTDDELEEAGAVAVRSVKKATGPITVMGTSLFTLITSFFQAIGDLFTGKIDGGIGGFFGHIKKLAAENTAASVGDNLQTGLEALAREGQKVGKFKWLTPDAISSSVAGAEKETMIAAGLAPKIKPEDVLNGMDLQKEYAGFTAGQAEAKILASVEKDMLAVTKGALGQDGKPSTFTFGKQLLGFAPGKDAAYEITNNISKTVTKLVIDESYEYKGSNESLKAQLLTGKKKPTDLSKEEFSELLKYETEKALKETRTKNGFLGYDLTDNDIAKIVETVPGYVKANYSNLKDINQKYNPTGNTGKTTTTATAIATAPTISPEKAAQLKKTLEDSFETPLPTKVADGSQKQLSMRQIFVDGLNKFGSKKIPPVTIALDDPYVNKAKAKFATIATEVIAANPRLLDQEEALSKAVLSKMLKEDPQFLNDSFAMLKNVGAPVGNTPNADVIILGLSKDFTALFKNPEFRKIIVNDSLITPTMIDANKNAPSKTGTTTETPAAVDVNSIQAGADDTLSIIRIVINEGLQQKFADSTPAAPNPIGEMFTQFTSLKGKDKVARLEKVAEEITKSGVISTNPADAKAVFIFKDGELTFKDPEIIKDSQKTEQAFEDAKRKIADSLNKGLDQKTQSREILMNNALAEGVALEMLDQALPTDKKLLETKIDPITKLQTKALKSGLAAKYAKNQLAVAEVALESEIKGMLNTPESHTLINLAAAGTDMSPEKLNGEKGIVKTIAKTMAKLVAEGVTDTGKVKKEVGEALVANRAITDPRALGPIVDMVGKEFERKTAAPIAGKPATIPNPEDAAIERGLAIAKAKQSIEETVSSMVDHTVDKFGEQAKEEIKKQGVYIDSGKWESAYLGWLGKALAPSQKRAMDFTIDTGVEKAKELIDRKLLAKVISESVITAAGNKYSDNGTTREFYQLSENQKKNAIANQVKERLENDQTYASIFPTYVPGIPELKELKPAIISQVVDGIKKEMKFASAPAQPKHEHLANGYVPSTGIPGVTATKTVGANV